MAWIGSCRHRRGGSGGSRHCLAGSCQPGVHAAERAADAEHRRRPGVDAAAGLSNLDTVTISGKTIPEVDANYQAPTPIDSQHGGFTDGLFTKPPVGSYPAYLNQPAYCASAIAANASCATIPYKSGTRAYIESQGYNIVANFGDQFSDLLGGFGDKTFKMPNPNYYLP